MPDISKIRLPGSNTDYDIKDAVAREAIAGGVSFIIAWAGNTTPVVADIPEGVTVTYQETTYTGTLSAETTGSGTHAQPGAFYLVASATQPTSETLDKFDEYVPVGTEGSKYWEKIGDTQINLTDVVTGVSLSKQTDTAIGTDSTFTVTQPTITLSEDSSTGVTFVRGGTTKYMKATASGGGTAWNSKDSVAAVTGYASPSTDTFVKSVSAETNKKMVTTTVPNVTSAGSASTWSFAMGSGDAAETLIIGGGNGNDVTATNTTLGDSLEATKVTMGNNLSASKVTLGTAITAATGATDAAGSGDAIVTGVTIGQSAAAITALGTPSTTNVLTGVKVTAQPTISLASNASTATGRVQVTTGISSATATNGAVNVTVSSVDAIVSMPTATAAAQSITVGTGDKVTVLTNATSLDVTKGNA